MKFLRSLTDGLTVSPYPLSYTLSYLWYARRPSIKNHTGMPLAPLSAPATMEQVARVILFGDLLEMPDPATVDDALRDVFACGDLIVGNLEGPLRSKPAADNAWLKAIDPGYFSGVLEATGIATAKLVLSVANNHSQDAGGDGLHDTLNALAGHGVEAVGQVVDGTPVICRRILDSDLRIAIVAWTHWLNNPPGQRFDDPADLGVLRAEDAVAVLSGVDADTRIALPHWDFEYQHFPAAATRARARELASAGCDVVSGGHPHVIQPLEVIDGCHVLYSQGNFLQQGHAISSSLASRLGVLFEVELHTAGERRGRVAGYRLYPYLHDRERNHLRLCSPDDEEAWALLGEIHDVSSEQRP